MDQLTAEQQQAVMMQAQQEANQRIMQSMMTSMTENCFKLCAGTSVSGRHFFRSALFCSISLSSCHSFSHILSCP